MTFRTRMICLGAVLAAAACFKLFWRYEWNPEELRGQIEWPEAGEMAEQSSLAPITLPVTIAFGPLGLGPNEAGTADLAMSLLSGDTDFKWVERRDLENAWRELELSQASELAPGDALRLGQMIGADWFIFGSAFTHQGQPASLVRIVEARSSAIRDLSIVAGRQTSPAEMAEALAAFISGAKENSAAGSKQTILALGTFRDVSLSGQNESFGGQLRDDLMKAFEASDVILLERDLVNQLFQESRLASSGLAGDGGKAHQMQSALWLVDGLYQVFESDGRQVDLVLRVEKTSQASLRRNIRGAFGNGIVQLAKAAIDEAFSQELPPPNLISRRKDEAHIQMERGMEFSRLDEVDLDLKIGPKPRTGGYSLQANPERRRANLLEAIKAFETVLLLDPMRTDAKLYLGVCLFDPVIDRVDEARNYFREIIAEPGLDRYRRRAKAALGYSYLEMPYASRTERDAVTAAEIFRQFADNATGMEKAVLEQGYMEARRRVEDGDESEKKEFRNSLEDHLIARLKSNTARGSVPWQGEFHTILDRIKTDLPRPEDAEKEVAALSDRLEAALPHLTPHIRTRVISAATATNSVLIQRFKESLAKARANPAEVFAIKDFFNHILGPPFSWGEDHHDVELRSAIVDAAIEAVEAGHANPLEDYRKADVIYFFYQTEQWAKGLEVLQSLGNRIIKVGAPWGRFPYPLQPFRYTELFREKVGLPKVDDPARFRFGDPYTRADQPFVFLIRDDTLWMASIGQITKTRIGDLQSERFSLPGAIRSHPSSIAISDGAVWVGFSLDGLVAFSIEDEDLKTYREADGLTLDKIQALHAKGERLWIGYGHAGEGGVGAIELATGVIRSFAAPFPEKEDPLGRRTNERDGYPPRKPVRSIISGNEGDLWLAVSGKGIQKFNPNNPSWITISSGDHEEAVSSLASNNTWLAAGSDRETGSSGPKHRMGGLRYFSLPDMSHTDMTEQDGLPTDTITSVALDGDILWVGGFGSLAIVDLPSKKVIKIADAPGRFVRRIQVVGDHVWVQVDNSLYRLQKSLAQFNPQAVATAEP